MADESDELLLDVAEDYVPYVPVKQRREQQLKQLQSRVQLVQQQQALSSSDVDSDSGGNAVVRRPVKRVRMHPSSSSANHANAGVAEEEEKLPEAGPMAKVSLIAQAVELKKHEPPKSREEMLLEEERRILESMQERKKLQSDYELAKGIRYTEPMTTSWKPPRYLRDLSEEELRARRQKYHLLVVGENVPAPIAWFEEMKLPRVVVEHLRQKGIKRPTPIQIQGLPVTLAGRDMIGVAHTGSGKTLAFTLPMVMCALEAEMKLTLTSGEGPVGVVLCPSRELARQTYENACGLADALAKDPRYPQLRTILCTGGVDMREQLREAHKGIHMVVATPGRLQHLLNTKKINFDICRYLCMDEADRMLDVGFEEDVRNILSYFRHQRQTVLYSATMPDKIREFAEDALVQPVVVNVGRAGAAALDVIQEVEFVKKEARIIYLLDCLQKTAPPVLIFAENKNDVDDILEFLLLKGVEAVATHGGKDQAEREYAIRSFREGKKDVLVATDVASKGLDFPDIQHVINFEMPREIEDYVHRIGRTGRGGKTGIATTLIHGEIKEQTLRDLKHLLIEAKQKVPPFLMSLEEPTEGLYGYSRLGGNAAATGVAAGCTYCGGLGHRVADCPKFLSQKGRQLNRVMHSGDGGGGNF